MDGIIIINKQKDYTSNDVVQIVKKIFKQKVGHTGTLDPMATGVLPVLVGKGTLLSKYLINHDKIYTATLKIGMKTDTGDITGNVIEQKECDAQILMNEEKINKALNSFVGKQKQIPPMYSAIKVNGKKLYEYARSGQNVEIAPREIEIYNMKLISISKEQKEITFRVSCSKGTYIRTLCEEIAETLGNIGTMSKLNREQVGEFKIEDSITLEDLESSKNFNVISIENFFKDKKEIILSPRSFIGFINGMKLLTDEPNDVYRIYDINKKFVGIGLVKSGILKRDIVI